MVAEQCTGELKIDLKRSDSCQVVPLRRLQVG
jgi:hypothetical protein